MVSFKILLFPIIRYSFFFQYIVKSSNNCRFPDINNGTFIVIDYQKFTDKFERSYSAKTKVEYKCQNSKEQLTNGTEFLMKQSFTISCEKVGSVWIWNGNAPYCAG